MAEKSGRKIGRKILGTVLAGALVFSGMKIKDYVNYRASPEYASESMLDSKAVSIFKSLKKNGRLEYNIYGGRVELGLEHYTTGAAHLPYGDQMWIRVNGNMVLESEMCRDPSGTFGFGGPEGHARKLETLKISTPDGQRVYNGEEISERGKWQEYYQGLIEKIYSEKSKVDAQVEPQNKLPAGMK